MTRPPLVESLRNLAQMPHDVAGAQEDIRAAADRIEVLEAALQPFAEPHGMGDNYVRFAPRLIERARSALSEPAQ